MFARAFESYVLQTINSMKSKCPVLYIRLKKMQWNVKTALKLNPQNKFFLIFFIYFFLSCFTLAPPSGQIYNREYTNFQEHDPMLLLMTR